MLHYIAATLRCNIFADILPLLQYQYFCNAFAILLSCRKILPQYCCNLFVLFIWIIRLQTWKSSVTFLPFRRNHTNVRNVRNPSRRRVILKATCTCIMVCGRSDATFAAVASANRPTWRITCSCIWEDVPIKSISSPSPICDRDS